MTRYEASDVFAQTSFLDGANATYLAELYALYEADPSSVSEDWRHFFANLGDDAKNVIADAQGPSWGAWNRAPSWKSGAQTTSLAVAPAGALTQAEALDAARDTLGARMLIRAYRTRGHLIAKLDPLRLIERGAHPELNPETYGFTPADYSRPIYIGGALGFEFADLAQVLAVLEKTYGGTIGFEYMHISDPDQRAWLQKRIEGSEIQFTAEGKRAILNKLIESEGSERFLNVKYTGTKRFGLDGGESMVPALEQIIKRGGQLGVREIVIGMPHRGRLNVLANVMAKPWRAIFNEFRGGSAHPDDVEGSGDVKYHLGASSDREFDDNRVHLSLTANPSHLEIVDPVVLGKVRAKQDQAGDTKRKTIMPLVLHGDAAFAGQGVVAECLGLSGLRGHRTGGSIHFIVNNQIGFTTAPRFSRSSPYPSDVAKMIDAPIFHVNGDDPEAVVHVTKIATEFRQRFGKPVVIDMFCYRRHGHNEADEPAFTQPLMYQRIAEHPRVVEIYADRLVKEGVLTQEEVDGLQAKFRDYLEEEFKAGETYRPNRADWLDGRWSGIGFADEGARRGLTGVDLDVLREVGHKLTKIPATLTPHKTIARIMAARRQSIDEGTGIDWATAESLAFGTLLVEGFKIRLSGQDSERGTFSHRHSVLMDQVNENKYTPLKHLGKEQGDFEVINSMLSEEAVLGFEYGYSLAEPNALVLWEAQFGDFANGAQVVIDQFISSGERKWLRMSGLVLLLPHGYEGQGPEHSSARLERYLQLCAEDNWQVVNCTTPANYFHVLRRQLHRQFRKPLVLMTPKSLLRHKKVKSDIEDFGPKSSFHRLLWDDAQRLEDSPIKLVPDEEIQRVVLCSGKVYYDLEAEREARGIDDIYLLRMEQLYPFPARALIQELGRFKQAEIVWCQEEPKNMGAWTFVEPNLTWVLEHIDAKSKRARYAGRPSSAATATGLMSKHTRELKTLLNEALG
ncbi:2-oxoglutarate dehydrogenase E1 component [Methyloceanibacter caenitepidi]|uniref:2-oxoglutarate dehydrogenase E1 component n=1 Tax=Methyloceanibacter caenitepidi TaxID=1384459 RepID=A0A0A8K0Q0_9HYPH|nr:2-oxoglutarate dehydrogenase E1 component [Methyloceanibacter caenitepidi]BAQ15579.1 2-oxoglutarate dehydrogenase E1 component [Methyloceanibacter caenitepidi]